MNLWRSIMKEKRELELADVNGRLEILHKMGECNDKLNSYYVNQIIDFTARKKVLEKVLNVN